MLQAHEILVEKNDPETEELLDPLRKRDKT